MIEKPPETKEIIKASVQARQLLGEHASEKDVGYVTNSISNVGFEHTKKAVLDLGVKPENATE